MTDVNSKLIEITSRLWQLEHRVFRLENPHASVLSPMREPRDGVFGEAAVIEDAGLEGSE